jgi:hypothetical protein
MKKQSGEPSANALLIHHRSTESTRMLHGRSLVGNPDPAAVQETATFFLSVFDRSRP